MFAELVKTAGASVADNAGAEFAAGYLWGTMNIDQEPYIATCFKKNSDLNDDLGDMMYDY